MKKIVTLTLALVMMLGALALFTACDKDENTLVMATNAAFPPYEYKEGNDIVGIDAEIAAAVAKKLGMKLEIVDVEFGSVLTGVSEGKYDMGMAGITVTEDRKKTMDFTETYATGIQVIIVNDGSDITSLDSLFVFDDEGNPVALQNTDIRVGVQQSTTGDIYSSSAVSGWGFNDLAEDDSIVTDRVVRYKTGADAIQALKSGKVNCVIIDNEPAKSFVEANEGIHILEGENEYAVEDYAICVKKGNKDLLDKINKALAELKADGTIAAIIEKYIPSKVADDTTADTAA
ncbi:MAG: transporter substrate-binding domain-containing protein [Clostridia bacterium]|nr:transporter substrate-binding domain-containing protein [Clostridia bacterium]MBQ5725747.1 transporter substrate-binding domain-containing protein [Clostridia bacterium]